MIIGYVQTEAGLQALKITKDNSSVIADAIWIDLLSPSRKEEKLLEQHLKIDVPTKKEMSEIELSSRLYTEDDALFMTVTMIAKSNSPEPKTDPVTFILSADKLLTVRYIEPHSFELFIRRILKRKIRSDLTADKILVSLLEATTDRLADILEFVSHRIDGISQNIFHSSHGHVPEKINYKATLETIGLNGDLETKVRESLVSFNRLLSFLEQSTLNRFDEKLQTRLKIVMKDLVSLSDYAGFISVKVSFLLDATLGLVNIEQNNIIKIFSVAAVVFLPPPLIASIYGMNFKTMPELQWSVGYPIAIVLMMLSAWLPYTYFKYRKWL
jgi:magnesium transporter